MNLPVTATSSLPWTGNLRRELVRLGWPIGVSMLSYSTMTLVDAVLVGHLGAYALAGVGLGGIVAFSTMCFGIGLLRAAKTLVSQAVGADDRGEIAAHLGAALWVALVLGVGTTAVAEFIALALPRVSATPAAGAAAGSYLAIRSLGVVPVLVGAALREVRYGQGDSRGPMAATIASNLVNVACAALFIYGFGWGVAGAAWATVIAVVVDVAVLRTLHADLAGSLRAARRAHLRMLWRLGLPTALQFVLEVGAFMLLTLMVSSLSEAQMAAHQIAIQVIHFSFLPAIAVGESSSVLAGQAVGARKGELVLPVAREALRLASFYTGACTIVIALGAPLIARGFTPDPSVREVAVKLLYVAAVFQIFDGANIVGRATLRGTGDVRYAAWVGILSAWALTPPMMWLLGYRAGWGAVGGWLGLCAEIMIAAALLWHRLERRWGQAPSTTPIRGTSPGP